MTNETYDRRGFLGIAGAGAVGPRSRVAGGRAEADNKTERSGNKGRPQPRLPKDADGRTRIASDACHA